MASLDSENFCDPFNKPISTNCRYFQLDVTAILILVSKHFSRLSSKNLQEYYSLSGQRHLSYQSDICIEIPSHPSSLERKTLSFSKYSQDSPMQEHTPRESCSSSESPAHPGIPRRSLILLLVISTSFLHQHSAKKDVYDSAT